MDSDYEKSLTTPSPDGPQFRPARGLMTAAGTFVIFCGLALCAVGWLYGKKFPEIMSASGGSAAPASGALNGVLASVGIMFGLIGVGTVILGFGSITLRKWARDLLVAYGWILVAFAVSMVFTMLIMIPSMMSMTRGIAGAGGAPVPAGASYAMIIGMVVISLFYLLLIGGPGALLLVIYRRKNVELTARYYHQAPSWTERCHTTVLVLWLFYVMGLIAIAAMFFGYVPLAAEFKLIPSQRAGYLILGVTLATLAVLTYGVSQAATWAWWASVIYAIAGIGLGYYMLSQFDWVAFNQQMMPSINDEKLTEAMKKQQEGSLRASYISGGLTWIIWLGYLFVIRKHFGKINPGEQLA
jgi:hypothetical protein